MNQKLTLLGSTGTSFVTTLGKLPEGPNKDFIQRMFLEMERIEHEFLLPGDRFVSEMLLICCFEKPVEVSGFFTVNGVEYSKQDHAYQYYANLQKVLVVVKKGGQVLTTRESDKNKNTEDSTVIPATA